MKAYLAFNLPEENEEHQLALTGWKYKAVVDDFYNYLRAKSKYEDVESLTVEELREKLSELRNQYDIID